MITFTLSWNLLLSIIGLILGFVLSYGMQYVMLFSRARIFKKIDETLELSMLLDWWPLILAVFYFIYVVASSFSWQ